MSIRSDRVCKRPWNFERVPNKQIEGNDKVEFIILFSKYPSGVENETKMTNFFRL